jgi:Protein of unknown function (DUF3891)
MIVRLSNESLLLITQPDHAALASRIMDRWLDPDLRESPHRDDILLAVREHDNGWAEVDAAPVLDPNTGRLLDFVHAPLDVRQGVWPRGIARLAHAPYAAALVAQHALHIYGRKRHDREWNGFFAQMERTRAQHLRRRGAGSLDDLQRDYEFVRVADLLSLAFCHGWRDPIAGEFGYDLRLEGGDLVITPDPLGGARVSLEISAKELPDRPFASDADALEAFNTARAVTLTGIARGA